MTSQTLQQCKWEYEAWQRSLEFLLNENTISKNRLTGFAKEKLELSALNSLESLLNTLLENDMILLLMLNEINASITSLRLETPDEKAIKDAFLKKYKKMRSDVSMVEEGMNQTRYRFNEILMEQLLAIS